MKPNKSFWNTINYRLKRADVEWIHGEPKIFYSYSTQDKKPPTNIMAWNELLQVACLHLSKSESIILVPGLSHITITKFSGFYWDFEWQDNTLGTRGGKWCFSQLQRSVFWGRVSPRFRDLVDNVFVHFPFEIASGSIRPDWGCLWTLFFSITLKSRLWVGNSNHLYRSGWDEPLP